MKDPKDYFSYDPITGVITRTKLHHNCKTPTNYRVDAFGYSLYSFDNKKLKGHRLAWYLHYGEWPKYDIDHINHNKLDNRICNLRDVPTNINCQNSYLASNNKTGHAGVVWHKQIKMWEARIGGIKSRKYLGVFKNFEDAVKAREAAEQELGYHQNHGKRAVVV